MIESFIKELHPNAKLVNHFKRIQEIALIGFKEMVDDRLMYFEFPSSTYVSNPSLCSFVEVVIRKV